MTLEAVFPDADVETETSTITRDESERLRELEDRIEKHGRRFARETYPLLLEIHDRKLYRARYKSWGTYCLNRWGWTSKSGIYYHLNAAKEDAAIRAKATEQGTTPDAVRTTQAASVDAKSKRSGGTAKSAGQRVAVPDLSPKATEPAPQAPKPQPPTAGDRILARVIGLLETVGTGKKWARETTRPQLLRQFIDIAARWGQEAQEGLAKRGIES